MVDYLTLPIVSLLRSSYHHTDLAIAKSDHSNISEEELEEVEVQEEEDTDTWKLCAKLGPAWHLEVMGTVLNNVSCLSHATFQDPVELELPVRSERRARVRDIEVSEVFWRISLEQNRSSSYVEEVSRLPSWESPDIFLDSEEEDKCEYGDAEHSTFVTIPLLDADPWAHCKPVCCSWDAYTSLYETILPDNNILWTETKILNVILTLEPFDCSKDTFLINIKSEENPEDIFENNLQIFEEPEVEDLSWGECPRSGSDWGRVILDTGDCGWNHGHLFGSLWDRHVAELEESASRQLRRQTKPRKTKHDASEFTTEILNLPAWDSLDIVHGEEAKVKPDDCKAIENEIEIFQSIKHIFYEYDTSKDEILTLPQSETNFVYQSTFEKCKNISKTLRQTFRSFNNINGKNKKIGEIPKKPNSVFSRLVRTVLKRK